MWLFAKLLDGKDDHLFSLIYDVQKIVHVDSSCRPHVYQSFPRRSLLNQIGRQACVFTFGFGAEHDGDLLHAVAEAGNGLFYYIDNSDSIPESFGDCLGGLLSVAAQVRRDDIRLAKLDPSPSCRHGEGSSLVLSSEWVVVSSEWVVVSS